MQTTLRIDDRLYRHAKSEAAKRGLSLTKLIEDSLRSFLSQKKASSQKKITLPSTALRVREGVDLDSGVKLRALADGNDFVRY